MYACEILRCDEYAHHTSSGVENRQRGMPDRVHNKFNFDDDDNLGGVNNSLLKFDSMKG